MFLNTLHHFHVSNSKDIIKQQIKDNNNDVPANMSMIQKGFRGLKRNLKESS